MLGVACRLWRQIHRLLYSLHLHFWDGDTGLRLSRSPLTHTLALFMLYMG